MELRLATTDHRGRNAQNRGKKEVSTPEPVVTKSRSVQNKCPRPQIAWWSTPSLDRSHPRLATTDRRGRNAQNRGKKEVLTPQPVVTKP